MVIQFAATFYLGAIIVCFILFGGLCEFLIAFKHDLNQRILCLGKEIFICSLKGYNRTTSDNINRKVCLHEIFQFHSQALQYVTELEITIFKDTNIVSNSSQLCLSLMNRLAENCSDNFKGTVTVMFLLSVTTICSTSLQLQHVCINWLGATRESVLSCVLEKVFSIVF